MREIVFYMHSSHESIELRRFSIGSQVNARARDGSRHEPEVRFLREGERVVALGCAADVDAFVVRLAPFDGSVLRHLDRAFIRFTPPDSGQLQILNELLKHVLPRLTCVVALIAFLML